MGSPHLPGWGDADRLPTISRIGAALERFTATEHGDIVRPSGVDPPERRLRVGDYRVRLRLRGGAVEVLAVRHRREAYR